MRQEVGIELELLFRTESARRTALLTGILGPAQLALAEDVTQEALLAALGHWSIEGIPANPSAWLLQAGRRKALDAIRRDRSAARLEPAVVREFEAREASHGEVGPARVTAAPRMPALGSARHVGTAPRGRLRLGPLPRRPLSVRRAPTTRNQQPQNPGHGVREDVPPPVPDRVAAFLAGHAAFAKAYGERAFAVELRTRGSIRIHDRLPPDNVSVEPATSAAKLRSISSQPPS